MGFANDASLLQTTAQDASNLWRDCVQWFAHQSKGTSSPWHRSTQHIFSIYITCSLAQHWHWQLSKIIKETFNFTHSHLVSPTPLAQDSKLKQMNDMQLSVVTDDIARRALLAQQLQYEENMERMHCEQFRLRCYMASLQSGELPNPKVIHYASLKIQLRAAGAIGAGARMKYMFSDWRWPWCWLFVARILDFENDLTFLLRSEHLCLIYRDPGSV